MQLADLALMPKIQLHCHLEGTVRPQTFRELARKHGVDIGARGHGPLEQTYGFATFGEFLLLFAEVCKALQTPDDFARIAREYAEQAVAESVVYAELFISPSVWTFFHRDLDVPSVVRAIRGALDEVRRAQGLEVKLIADVTRNFGPQRALESVREAAGMQDLGVIGIGLGGDEVNYPPELFVEGYAEARRAGLRTVVHAGEAAGAHSVRRALDDLGAERIGHGIRSLEDDALIAELARRRMALEVCPTSNRLTGVVGPDRRHPIEELDGRGVICVIDTDDPALFNTTLIDEYAGVAELMGIERTLRLARNAIDASFASAERKAALHSRFDAFCAERAGLRRTG